MRSFRSSFIALGRTICVSGLLALGLVTFAPESAQACPNKEGACACGAACPAEHAGNCGAAAGGCAGKDEKGACACPAGENGNCAKCGADCGAKHGGECKASGGKAAGTCGCSGAAAAATAPSGEAAMGGQAGGADLRAVIDPLTGELVEPGKGDGEAPSAVVPEADLSERSAASDAPRQVAVPGGGVMAPFPKERASHAVAKVNEEGHAHAGCEHGEE
ncbi:MAG: post-PEP-CTERM-1 domain-containing protein [Candidatus Binatia bacterium]